MIEVRSRQQVSKEFGCLSSKCADCGELVLFAKDVFGDRNWVHKVDKGRGFYGFDNYCPKRKEIK